MRGSGKERQSGVGWWDRVRESGSESLREVVVVGSSGSEGWREEVVVGVK